MSASDSALREHVALAIQAHQTVCGPDYQGMAAAALRAIDAWGAGAAASQDARLREIVREEFARRDGGLAAPESAEAEAGHDAALSRVPVGTVNAAEIRAKMTPAGAWTRATLAGWGVPWPPPRGWRQRLTKAADGMTLNSSGSDHNGAAA